MSSEPQTGFHRNTIGGFEGNAQIAKSKRRSTHFASAPRRARRRAARVCSLAMPPKKGGTKKKGKKKKGPSYMTHEDGVDHCAPFGFQPGDIIHTPLGLRASVLGVKYATPEDLGGGVLWVKYEDPSEKEAPIENPASVSGYARASETERLRREVDRLNAAAAAKRSAREAALARKENEEAAASAKTRSSSMTAKKPAPIAGQRKSEESGACVESTAGDGKENETAKTS